MDRNHVAVHSDTLSAVALRKESVDRNIDTQNFCVCVIQSLSARRAWIEMTLTALWSFAALVALRKESVDRNRCPIKRSISRISRSPQGERG